MGEVSSPAGLTNAITDLERRTIARVTRRLLPLLMACYFVAYLDRVNVGFASLTMNKALGFSASVYGFGAGIFFLGYCTFEVPSNLLLERYGAPHMAVARHDHMGPRLFQHGVQRMRQAVELVVRLAHRHAVHDFAPHDPLCAAVDGLDGVFELRVHFGPGYRVYYAIAGKQIILLLCAGNKRSQQADIKRVCSYWGEWQTRASDER